MSSSAVKRKLSGSTDGMAIKVTQEASPGDIIHTAIAGTTPGTYDEIWLWAHNGHTADVWLTIEFGGVTVPDQTIVVLIPFKSGVIPVIPGFILHNSRIVRAFASVANVLTVVGSANSMVD